MRRLIRLSLALAVTLSLALLPGIGVRASHAQSYARFDVPDSSLTTSLAAARAEFEATWNTLRLATLRAKLARADSAQRLERLGQRIAKAEPAALGSRIGLDALALEKRWKRAQWQSRVDAAVAESLALVARNGREFDRADSLLATALDRYRALGERRREAWVLGSRGANWLVAGRNAVAALAYEPALVARRALGDSVLIGNTLNDLGQVYVQLSRYDDAWRVLHEACAVREAQRRMGPLGSSLNFLGLALAARGKADSALACFQRSMVLVSASGDSARTLLVLTNYANVLGNAGDFEESKRITARALAIANALGAAAQVADLENNLGNFERSSGRYVSALAHFDRAIEAFTQSGDRERLALALSRKGLTLLAIGDPDPARPVFNRALALTDSIDSPGVRSKVLSALAMAAQHMDDATRARQLANSAYGAAITHGDSTAIHDSAALQAYLERERGDYVSSERWSRRAITASAGMRAEVRANDLSALGGALQLQGRLDEAESRQREALKIAEEHGANNEAMLALCNLGDVNERRKDDASALGWYARAAAMADTIRTLQSAERQSISAFANRLYVFEAMIHLLGRRERAELGRGHAEQAFEWAERSRARAFIDLVTSGGGVAARAPAATLREAQALLRSDAQALLEYSVGDSSTTLWVVRRSGWRSFTLPPRSALRPRVQALRRGLADPALAEAPLTLRAARALYSMLVAPAESLLVDVDELIVAPDGPLSLIPFEALLMRDPAPSGGVARGAFLVERYSVSYTPSTSVLATRTAITSDSLVVCVGAPEFGAEPVRSPGMQRGEPAPLVSLPSTAVEIEAIRALAGARRCVTLTGAAASRAGVLALPELARAGVLHFATHGDVDEAEPEHSGLWLAPDAAGEPPSRIEVADIMNLRLSAGLVTLSACQTGLGRLEDGEGVVGTMRAFMAAGAQSVLVSLWPVNDRSTAALMTSFYRGALNGRTSRGRALTLAKRALLATPSTRAPFYWAPFVLVGQAATR